MARNSESEPLFENEQLMASESSCESASIGVVDKGEKINPISAFTGYCLTVNYAVGTGVLGLPLAFYEASIGTSICTLLFVSFCSCIGALMLNDVVSRSLALRRAKHCPKEVDGKVVPDYSIPTQVRLDTPSICKQLL
ncbi:hypothetical protein KIPB_010843, partial [Kipferlia bialata]|eukprot:g10843.t1